MPLELRQLVQIMQRLQLQPLAAAAAAAEKKKKKSKMYHFRQDYVVSFNPALEDLMV